MTRAATTLAGPCTGAPRRDFLLGLRHGQLVGAHVPSWCSGHGVDAGCSQRAGPPGQLTSRSYQTPAEGTGLEAIYEQDFLPCSYGFRPGRSAHQALDALRAACMGCGVRWCIDVDIKSYFDTIDHGHLRDFLDQRVTDGVIRRMINKWLKAGVLEEGRLHRPTQGSPQGGVITPPTMVQNFLSIWP